MAASKDETLQSEDRSRQKNTTDISYFACDKFIHNVHLYECQSIFHNNFNLAMPTKYDYSNKSNSHFKVFLLNSLRSMT